MKPAPRYLALTAMLCIGCGSSPQLMPLSVGKKWQYRFRWGRQDEIGPMEVVREIPVDGQTGWELRSPMGVSRLAYVGNELVTDQLSGAFIRPAMPIGVPNGKKTQWMGWLITPSGKKAAKAQIAAAPDKVEIMGQKRTLSKTTVQLKSDGHRIELATWYAPGDGIIFQQQITDNDSTLRIERLSGG